MVGTLAHGMRQRWSLIALALALALGGCTAQRTGSSDSSTNFKGQPRLVANVIEDFESAASKNDHDAICRDMLASTLVRQIAQHAGTCATGVEDALKDTDVFAITVKSVRIAGNRATAGVTVDLGNRDRPQSMALTRQGPGWRISRFG
jgi:hypothetical protein